MNETKLQACELHGTGGFAVSVLAFGARVQRVLAADRDGRIGNVVLSCADVEAYQSDKWHLGATIGRYGNRIAGASFDLDGKTYHLAANESGNTLHGGIAGFDRVFWDIVAMGTDRDGDWVELHYLSPDGDQGFPGALSTSVRYMVTRENVLRIDYRAATSAPTHVNLTNHSYFNLSGDPERSVADHAVQVFASNYTPVDAQKIPTGKIATVDGTPYDLREPQTIDGIDTNFVLDRSGNRELVPAARVWHEKTGRSLLVETTEPGLQLFSGKGNGIALETQHFPDSPHHPNFPSTVLEPGEEYSSTTVFRFSKISTA